MLVLTGLMASPVSPTILSSLSVPFSPFIGPLLVLLLLEAYLRLWRMRGRWSLGVRGWGLGVGGWLLVVGGWFQEALRASLAVVAVNSPTTNLGVGTGRTPSNRRSGSVRTQTPSSPTVAARTPPYMTFAAVFRAHRYRRHRSRDLSLGRVVNPYPYLGSGC